MYLGHRISEKGIEPDPDKVEVIKKWPVPKNAADVKQFVAFINYYRKFMALFAELTVPLNRLTKHGVPFDWDETCQFSFEELKRIISNPPLLQYPDFSENAKFILRTDASKIALGAVLSNSNDLPVAYSSRPISKEEKNYSIVELELLAIVWAVQHFRPYLYGKYFDILTDHRPFVSTSI